MTAPNIILVEDDDVRLVLCAEPKMTQAGYKTEQDNDRATAHDRQECMEKLTPFCPVGSIAVWIPFGCRGVARKFRRSGPNVVSVVDGSHRTG